MAPFLTAGGGPGLVKRDMLLIIATATRDHPDWLYRPARKRIAREEAL